jgi:hypothetical protein
MHSIFFVFQLLHFQAHSSFYYTHMISHCSRSIIYHPFFRFNVSFFQFAPCNGNTTIIVIIDYFPPCCFVVIKVLFLCYEVEGETIRLIMLLIKDFMAFGTRLLVKSVKDGNVLHHFRFSFDFNC